MFRSGKFVAKRLRKANDEPLSSDQVQPNGVDLTLGTVYEQSSPGRIDRDGKTVGERLELEPDDGAFRLEPGNYVAEYGEVVRVPDSHVGFVYPRSSLMRNSAMLHTAVWDAGYEGIGEGLLQVGHEIEIRRGARIGQFVLAAADHEGVYEGEYQGERL
ncbi:dUTP pyrophosphatase [Halalkaliarchaeum desulfuricum]|uniref:dUTP pyrophosphatase n=1 Tax=Halalkaliarchaeum desulfuricum TaxID=2055893 RepID=A0A343TKQ1_9EURY|nr:deoxyuridine 5'-triphosphate nucleotidohydrolase [Halalkaliarchaeum desulfuricum]AUX09673.1 dUTP pyrophosphatase [Halalkaliarchaeum desulfuricum]